MTDAVTGWGGQFWLMNAASTPALVKLEEVVRFGLPSPESEEVEATHLESPGRRREYISGMVEDGETEVTLNYVAGSPTDLLIQGALGQVREFKQVVPNKGTGRTFEGSCLVRKYDRGEVEVDGKLEAVMTIRYTGAVTEAAVA